MKKILGLGILSVFTALSLTACGTSTSNTKTVTTDPETTAAVSEAKKEDKQEVKIRLGSHLAPDHSVVVTANKFKELVTEKSAGRIEVTVHPSGELGDQKELVENLQLGSIEMTVNDAGLLSNFVPQVGILDMPYLFTDFDHVHKTFDGPVGKALQEKMKEQGIHSLAWFDSAFRNTLLTKNKKIDSFEQLKGMKIRTPQAPSVIDTVNSWGALPTPIAWGELYTSLETGVVNGFEGSAESIYSAKLYEVSKYIVKTEHIFTALSLNISEKFMKGLSEEDQRIIEEAALESGEYGRKLAMDRDKEYFDKLVAAGMEVIEVDKAPFIKAGENIVNQYAEKVGAVDLVKQIRNK